jgi:hypothetical protein
MLKNRGVENEIFKTDIGSKNIKTLEELIYLKQNENRKYS